jgi:hypothetical protein
MSTTTIAGIREKCSKRHPSMCQRHKGEYKAAQDFMEQIKNREKELHLKAVTDADFEASWKLKKEKDGSTSIAVYRSGVPSAPKQRGVENGHYARADATIPSGRQPRMNGVFASPTLGGVCRWVRGNYMTNKDDVKVRELRVDVDNTYVYSVEAWEKASSNDTPAAYKEYWDTGLTMREYMAKARQDPDTYNPTEWELLVPEEKIISVKPVGAARTAQRAYRDYDGREVKNILEDKPRRLWK